MAYRAGYAGKVSVNTSTVLFVKSWKADAEAAPLETTDTGTSGYRTYIKGLQMLTVQIEAEWDATTNPYAQSPTLAEGSTVACKLYANNGDTLPVYSMTTSASGNGLYIEKVSVNMSVDGVVTYTIQGKSSGPYVASAS